MTLPRFKQKRVDDRPYLNWLKTQRCIITGQYGNQYEAVDPCHIGTRGRGLKSSDDEALPILHSIHQTVLHQSGEMTGFRELLPNVVLREALRAYAREMYEAWRQDR